MTPADDLDRLLSVFADGEPTDADRVTLAALLRDDPAAQAAYLDYMAVDALLRWDAGHAPPIAPARPARRWPRVLAAGAAGVVAAVAAFRLTAPPDVAAEPHVVDRLADWTVALADAPTPAARRAAFAERNDRFAAELSSADLPPADRRLAAELFDKARGLAGETDPAAVAERLDAASEVLHAWLWDRGGPPADPARAAAVERHYLRFVERSVGHLARAADAADPKAARRKLEKVADRIARRAEARAARQAGR